MHKKQRGLTMISWMIIIGFLAIQGIMAMRIIPVYLNYGTVKSILDELAASPDVKDKNAKAINQLLRKRLGINNLYKLEKSKDAFKFSKIPNGYHIVCKYEDRGPIFKNLEFVATFKHEVDIITK